MPFGTEECPDRRRCGKPQYTILTVEKSNLHQNPHASPAKGSGKRRDGIPASIRGICISVPLGRVSDYCSCLYFCARLADNRCASSVCPLRCRRSIRFFMNSGLFLPRRLLCAFRHSSRHPTLCRYGSKNRKACKATPESWFETSPVLPPHRTSAPGDSGPRPSRQSPSDSWGRWRVPP